MHSFITFFTYDEHSYCNDVDSTARRVNLNSLAKRVDAYSVKIAARPSR